MLVSGKMFCLGLVLKTEVFFVRAGLEIKVSALTESVKHTSNFITLRNNFKRNGVDSSYSEIDNEKVDNVFRHLW